MSTDRFVAIISLGGTIAMSNEAATAGLSPDDLVAAVPQLNDVGVALQTHDFRRLPSAQLTFSDLEEVAALARKCINDGAVGVVVTQGTDTIEESSYLLDLLQTHDEPLVVTGAMRHSTLAGPDGPANLLAAVQVAASDNARNRGVLVVLNDEVHAACEVVKAHSFSPAAFTSPLGPLGYVVEGQVRLLRSVTRSTNVNATDIDGKRVHLHTAMLGDKSTLAPLLENCDGLVIAGFGAGHVPATFLSDATPELLTQKPVVFCTRSGGGSTLRNTYSYAGSETDLLARGFIPAGFLPPLKARILLQVLLVAGTDLETIRSTFAHEGDCETDQSV